MTKTIAQNISLFSYADTFNIRGDDRAAAAKGGIFATSWMLTRREVSCPKGSTITIMSNDLTGEEIDELASFAGYRHGLSIKFEAPPKTLVQELDHHRKTAINWLTGGHLRQARAYARLMTAIENVHAAREDLKLTMSTAA